MSSFSFEAYMQQKHWYQKDRAAMREILIFLKIKIISKYEMITMK